MMIYLFSYDFGDYVTHCFFSDMILSSFDETENRISTERKYSLYDYKFIDIIRHKRYKQPVKLKFVRRDQDELVKGAESLIITHLISEL